MARALPAGWRELTPGAYADGAGGLHLDLAAMLEGNGYADTPANRAALEGAAADLASELGLTLEVAE